MESKMRRSQLPSALMVGVLLASSLGVALRAESQHLTVIPASESRRQVHVVTHGIKWYSSLPEARAAARKDKKLIVWIHMLGQIDGKT